MKGKTVAYMSHNLPNKRTMSDIRYALSRGGFLSYNYPNRKGMYVYVPLAWRNKIRATLMPWARSLYARPAR